jgi:hypothetical protein
LIEALADFSVGGRYKNVQPPMISTVFLESGEWLRLMTSVADTFGRSESHVSEDFQISLKLQTLVGTAVYWHVQRSVADLTSGLDTPVGDVQ